MSELSRLRWKCRRGTKELDVILGGFLERGFDALPAEDVAVFETLLDEQDDRLMDYFYGKDAPADAEQRRLVDTIRRHAGP